MEHEEIHTKAIKGGYPEATAGWHMVTQIPVARAGNITGKILERLKGAHWDTISYIYVVDEGRVLKGVVSLPHLFAADPLIPIERLMENRLVTVHPEADQEDVVILAVQHAKKAIPVVDKGNRLLGVVPPHSILNIMHQEHIEDLLRLVGVMNHSMAERTWGLVRSRAPWLLLGLMGGIVAASVVNLFESALRQELALAFFVPLIVYMADAVGTQTETIFIRSLSFKIGDISSYIWREVKIGTSIGLIFGGLSFLLVYLFWGKVNIALTIGLSMFTTISIAVLIAVFIPWLLFKLKKDPAYGSGPFATVVQDILSIIFYFIIASRLIRWT